ncbi:hypothetical protein Ancab_002400 [Ancistrocladus abbreviatus]
MWREYSSTPLNARHSVSHLGVEEFQVLDQFTQVISFDAATFKEESMACLAAITEAVLQEWHRIIILGDCKEVINCLNGISSPPWRIEHVICRVLDLSEAIQDVSFRFIPKQANGTAHGLAQWGKRCNVREKLSLLSLYQGPLEEFYKEKLFAL